MCPLKIKIVFRYLVLFCGLVFCELKGQGGTYSQYPKSMSDSKIKVVLWFGVPRDQGCGGFHVFNTQT